METFSALLAIYTGNSPVPGDFHTQRPVTRSFDIFICVWINGWVNNGEAGDLRRYRAHYDVTVMNTGMMSVTRWGRVTHIYVSQLRHNFLIMACHKYGTKSFFKSIVIYC